MSSRGTSPVLTSGFWSKKTHSLVLLPLKQRGTSLHPQATQPQLHPMSVALIGLLGHSLMVFEVTRQDIHFLLHSSQM